MKCMLWEATNKVQRNLICLARNGCSSLIILIWLRITWYWLHYIIDFFKDSWACVFYNEIRSEDKIRAETLNLSFIKEW